MIKVLQITGFYPTTDKFGNNQWQIDGVAFERNKNYTGFPTKRMWIRRDVIAFTEADVKKTLWVEYNERGNVVKAEVK